MQHALSDFDVMVARLVNWGRWGRQDSGKPDPNGGCGSIYQMGRADRDGDGDGEDAPDEPRDPVDPQDADALDDMICKLSPRHYQAVRDHFYRSRPVSRETVAEAVRALCDREQCIISTINAGRY